MRDDQTDSLFPDYTTNGYITAILQVELSENRDKWELWICSNFRL